MIDVVRRSRLISDERGVSMVEMLFSAMLMLVVLGLLSTTLSSVARTGREQDESALRLDAVRNAIASVSKDLRQAMSIDPASTSTRLQIETIVDENDASVVIELVGAEIVRTVNGDTVRTLATEVLANPIFCYDPPTCPVDAADISASSTVRVEISTQPTVAGGQPLRMRTEVQLRNATEY